MKHIQCTMHWVILLSPFLLGLYFPWTAALCVLLLLLLFSLKREPIRLSRSPLFAACLSIPLFAMAGVFWGTDRGMAPVGFLQFLPLPLFTLAIEQLGIPVRKSLWSRLPEAGALMTILSVLLSHILCLSPWFLINNRLAGFFQYPNAFAAFLLVGTVLLLFEKAQNRWLMPVLLLGIFLSGSRTVFVLLLILLLFYTIHEKRWLLLIPILLLPLSLFFFVPGRIHSISLSASEFLGRLLYARDALPVILKHPLGLGYTGYSWLQGSFQTGVYTVQQVHNDFLQILLDVGWLPAALCAFALARGFHRADLCRKLIILLLGLHSLLDFDLQYPALAFLLILALDWETAEKPHRVSSCISFASVLLCLFSCWLGLASFFLWTGDAGSAVRVYPAYTTALVRQLAESPEAEQAEIAERILRMNDSVSLAHNVAAHAAFNEGNILGMVEHKQDVLRLSKYRRDEYLDYLDMLIVSRELYSSRGDENSTSLCTALMREVPTRMQQVLDSTSVLGWKIRDLPDLNLPEEYLQAIEKSS